MKRGKIVVAMALVALISGLGINSYAQQRMLQYWRPNDMRGLNVFEAPKIDTVEFDGVYVRVGGDFAFQYQALDHSNDLDGDGQFPLVELGNNFNLPVANLNLDVQLYDGVRMHLRTYLSSRHHAEAWVKGGYLRIDKLDFIKEGFLEGLMDVAFFRVGLDEINYGDAHFRRSDNARTIFNPFVGNYIMDAFTTEAFGEFTVLTPGGIIGMVGLSNGRLNQDVTSPDKGMSFYAKLGYDNQAIGDDLRFRLTGSIYASSDESTREYLYSGDRAGGRYYKILQGVNDARVNDFSPRFDPRFSSVTAIQINPFVSAGGFEFFGIYERADNGDSDIGGSYTQLAGEAIYRFGNWDQLYVGARYNTVSGNATDNAENGKINRFNVGGGWFMTKNIVTKVEYVSENYDGDGWNGGKFQGAQWDGIMIEAAISF
jgi:hypothetical protein